MIQVIYTIPPDRKEEEVEWLRSQKIYPGVEDQYDWMNCRPVTKIAVIVTPDVAMWIKLRNNLDYQEHWTRK
jgi:hypothetical protein